jgi:hypothetical protein
MKYVVYYLEVFQIGYDKATVLKQVRYPNQFATEKEARDRAVELSTQIYPTTILKVY